MAERRYQYHKDNRKKTVSLSDKFTLIITVHERQQFIESLLEYYSDLPCDIIVADSSVDVCKVTDWSHVKIVHAPNELYYKKMLDVLSEIKTPFVLELSDDDIIFKEAIHECVNFLENNPDYSFVDGIWAKRYKKQTSYFIESNFYSEDPIERIQVCLNDYWKAPNHSVVKADVLRRNYAFQFENEILWPIRWYDKIWMFLACFDGNYKALPISYGSRRNERLMDTLKHYPKKLRKDTPWTDILLGDNLVPLINFCINQGHDKEWSEDFVKRVAAGIS